MKWKGEPVRFDDRLDTVLKIDPAYESGRISIWRQLVDMLAQSGRSLSPEAAQKSFLALAMLRPRVPLAVRTASVRPLTQRFSFAPLVAFLANDHPQVAIACVDSASLTSSEWLAIVGELGPVGRSRLRARTDLDASVARALAAYGVRDLTLAGTRTAAASDTAADALDRVGQPDVPDHEEQDGPTTPASNDIAELVRRIDQYRAQKDNVAVPLCRIRCDGEGNVRAVSGVQRGRFIGLSLAQPARPAEAGCDAGTARAFAKRAPIRDGRIFISGDGADAGYWRISADPQFERENGRFIGYTGHLGRLAVGAEPSQPVLADEQIDHPAAEGMRQLVHELRSPLNAISGFAQLINGQYFGPVSQTYRSIAGGIIADAQKLAEAIKDMDLAARLDSGRVSPADGTVEIRAIFVDVVGRAVARGDLPPSLDTQPADQDLMVNVPQDDAAEMIDRLIRALTQLRSASGPLRLSLSSDTGHSMATLILPILPALNRDELARALDNDISISPEQGTTVLGPGFGLRLVGQMAQLHGGSLNVTAGQCILNLPLVEDGTGRFVVSGEPSSVAAP